MKIESYERPDHISLLRRRPGDTLFRIVLCQWEYLFVDYSGSSSCLGGGPKRDVEVDLRCKLFEALNGKTLKYQRAHPAIP
jgi:hypothetical protein